MCNYQEAEAEAERNEKGRKAGTEEIRRLLKFSEKESGLLDCLV